MKRFLIQFRLYIPIERDYFYDKKTVIVYADCYESAIVKLKHGFKGYEIHDIKNLTLL